MRNPDAIQALRNLLAFAQVEALSGYPLENDPVNAALKAAIGALEREPAAQRVIEATRKHADSGPEWHARNLVEALNAYDEAVGDGGS